MADEEVEPAVTVDVAHRETSKAQRGRRGVEARRRERGPGLGVITEVQRRSGGGAQHVEVSTSIKLQHADDPGRAFVLEYVGERRVVGERASADCPQRS
jgi:hypothetical protein